MEVKASLNNLRVSPRKVRLLADLIRGLDVNKALDQLNFSNKRAKTPLMKLLNSAIANAEHNFNFQKDNLRIKTITVDEDKTLKRWMPRAYGRATTIRKRGSRVNIVLEEIQSSGKVETRKEKIEKPINISDLGKQVEKESKKENKNEKKSEDKKIDAKKKSFTKNNQDKTEKGDSKGLSQKMFRRKAG
ncbi:50S ribosomal protein L22 [bacterium]|nr:50S ribosomal protein L22 [bacterium]